MAILVLLQKDLRLSDNPALFYAVEQRLPVIVLYIKEQNLGAANLWWLSKSLALFKEQLAKYKIPFLFLSQSFENFIKELQRLVQIKAIYSNGLDFTLAAHLADIHKVFTDNLLFQHEKIEKEFKIFTPFWKYLCKTQAPDIPLPKPEFSPANHLDIDLSKFTNFSLLSGYNWWRKFDGRWQIGEIAANNALEEFKQNALTLYDQGRNIPSKKYTSKLSPHIRFGEISVRQIYDILQREFGLTGLAENKFMRELGWREFSYHLKSYHPNIAIIALNPKYINFYPDINHELLEKWQQGQTGYPMVDAGMRQLWQSGWMHNRVRMITASFLTKNLLIPWQVGEQWFADCLVDADPAVNPTSWQWVAGCGTDSTPYFRIFNPILQGKQHDPDGEYIKNWIPQLRNFDKQYLYEPHLASSSLFDMEDEKYPEPIIDFKKSRAKALTIYKNII